MLFDESLFTHGLDRKNFYIAVVGIIMILLVDLIHERGAKIREGIVAIALVAVFAIYGPGFDASGFAYGEY